MESGSVRGAVSERPGDSADSHSQPLSGRQTAFVLSFLAAVLTALLLIQPGGGEGGSGEHAGESLTRAPVPSAVAAGLDSTGGDSLETMPAENLPELWTQPRGSASGNAFWGPDISGPFDTLWEIRTGYELFASPAILDGILYFGCNDSHFRAVDSADGRAVWAFPVQCGISAEAAVDSQRVYFGGQDGYLYCLDRQRGTQIWKAGLGYHILCDAALIADSLVLTGNSRGGVAAVSTGDGQVVWSDNLGGLVLGVTVTDSLAVVSTESGRVAAYGFDGTRFWNRDLGHQASQPSASQGRVLVGLSNGTVRCLSLEEGSDMWAADLQAGGYRAVVGRPVVRGDRVLAGTSHSRVACIGLEDGSVLWNREMENWVQVPPSVGDSLVYVSCDDKRLHILSLADGSSVDSLEIGSYSGTAPTVVGGVVYLGTAGGNMAALRGTVHHPPDTVSTDTVLPDSTDGGAGL